MFIKCSGRVDISVFFKADILLSTDTFLIRSRIKQCERNSSQIETVSLTTET